MYNIENHNVSYIIKENRTIIIISKLGARNGECLGLTPLHSGAAAADGGDDAVDAADNGAPALLAISCGS